MRDPLLVPTILYLAGIVAGRMLEFGEWDALWPAAALAMLAGIARACASPNTARFAAALAILFAGALVHAWHRPPPPPVIDAGPREILALEGCVVEPTALARDRGQFTLELEPGARARINLPIGEDAPPQRLAYGQRVEIEARLRRPHNYNNPGGFDYAAYLARRDIFWIGFMSRNAGAKILDGRCGSRFLAAVFRLRTVLLDRIERLYSGDEYATAMMQAVLVGETARLERVWTEDFRRTGSFHALVVSGVHVTVLAGVLLFFLRLLPISEMAALGATAAVAWLYALIAGLSPPVTRAAGGFTLYLVARFLFRRTRILNLLAAVTVVYLTWDPEELFEASFQLSFLAVAALGAFAVPWVEATSGPLARGMRGIANVGADPHLEPHVAQWRVEVRLAAETIALWTRLPVRWAQEILACFFRGTAFLYELVVVSVAVQTGLALAMIVYFHRLSLTAITSNLVIVPAMNVAIPAGYLAVASGWQWVGGIAHWFLWLSARTAAWHAQVEPLPRLADPPGWLSTALIAALLAGVVLGQSRLARWTVGTVLAGLLALLVWQPWPPRIEPGTLEVTAIDVGQGDSLLVVFPRGSTMLIDGGGILSFGRTRRVNFDIGEDVVSPYLWSRGIRRIDVMVATHAHQDHIGGIPALMANFHPRELWTGANPSPDLTAAARRLGVSVFERRAGPPFEYSGARVRILAPPLAYGPSKPGNGDSLALRLEYGSNSFLLTGDLERPGELDLVFDSGLGPADVLKVGHHGSRTSTNEPFLDAVSPSIAMISTGYENSFGHPHPDVLARLRARNAAILRTDLDGRVTVRSDGRRLWFDRERWREPGLATKFPVLDGLVQ